MLKLTLLFILITNSVFAEDKKESSKMVVSSVEENEELRKLLKVPGVQEKYDECKNEKNDLDKMPGCIWGKLDAKTKEAVQAAYKETLMVKESEKKSTKDITANQTNIKMNFSAEQNKGYEKLSEIIGKKLHESLYGEKPDKDKVYAIDHTKFHDLYKTELSKAIVDSMTNFCLKTDLSKPIDKIPTSSSCQDEKCIGVKEGKELDECKEKAKPNCLLFTFSSNPDHNVKINLAAMNDGTINESMVTSCMGSIPAICNNNGISRSAGSETTEACVVVENLKAIRKNLVLNEKLSKIYDETVGVNKSINMEMKNLTKASSDKDDTMKAVTVTSADIEKAYRDQDDILKREAEDCAKNPQNANCSKFLDTNKDEKEKSVVEFGLRQFAQGDELEKSLDTKNKDVFKEYLEKLGYSKEKITELLSNDKTLEEVKALIKSKFENQKVSLINELAERVSKSTTKENGTSGEVDKNRYQQIGVELANKTNTLKSMVRFNNIASSYLTIEEKGRSPSSTDKAKANTASLKEELNADKSNLDNKKIAETKKDILSDPKGSGNAFLEVTDLNDILGW